MLQLSERAGVVNVGVEGVMRAGAFAAAVAALVMPTALGVLVGMAAGAAVAAVHGFGCIRWRSDQVVSGMALNLVMLALGTFLLEAVFSSPSATPSITQREVHREEEGRGCVAIPTTDNRQPTTDSYPSQPGGAR